MEFHTLSLGVDKTLSMRVLAEENKDKVLLWGELGQTIPKNTEFSFRQPNDHMIAIEWKDFGTLSITHEAYSNGGHRYNFNWRLSKAAKLWSQVLEDWFDMNYAHWYGGAQIKEMMWPMEKWKRKLAPYVSNDSFNAEQYGGVLERYWLSSLGLALFVDAEVPLFVGINSGKDMRLDFVSKYESPYKNVDDTQLFLKYSLFHSSNAKRVHELVLNTVFSKPSDIPDEMMFRYPIWSTWAKYKKNINQDIIMEYGDEILKHGFKACQLEIDDDWTPAYGDMEFDKNKFPAARKMIEELKEKGFRVTAWVHPFASPRSNAFSNSDYWIKSSAPIGGMCTWWNGVGRLLDVTNTAAVTWYLESMKTLREQYGLLSFKFDAGETNWMPKWPVTHLPLRNPTVYSTIYAEMAYEADKDARAQEVRVGFRTQHLPVFVRMMDKVSTWNYDNGLQSLIPHALTFSIIGYPFILPDMIGGNAYGNYPDRELYIRWLEANAFLPSLQFSIAPWEYDDEVVRIAKKMTTLHEQYADKMILLARECVKTGAPIIRPLWWLDPYDDVAQTIDSEFLVGDDLLVAPVLQKEAVCRDIYLPAGMWKSGLTGEVLWGGRWHNAYPAYLDELPYFTRITTDDPPGVPTSTSSEISSGLSSTTTETPDEARDDSTEDDLSPVADKPASDQQTSEGESQESVTKTASTDEAQEATSLIADDTPPGAPQAQEENANEVQEATEVTESDQTEGESASPDNEQSETEEKGEDTATSVTPESEQQELVASDPSAGGETSPEEQPPKDDSKPTSETSPT